MPSFWEGSFLSFIGAKHYAFFDLDVSDLGGVNEPAMSLLRSHVSLISCSLVLSLGTGVLHFRDLLDADPDIRSRPSQLGLSLLSALATGYPPETKVEHVSTDMVQRRVGANEIFYSRCTDKSTGVSHELYVARWRAGNPYCFEAGLHPPDLCWPGAGWSCSEALSGATINLDGSMYGRFEWRRFVAKNTAPQEVLYWCIVGNKVIDLSQHAPSESLPLSGRGIIDAIRGSGFLLYWFGNSVRRIPSPSETDVYFVRLNTSDRLSDVIRGPAFSHQKLVMRRLGLLPLVQNEKSQPETLENRPR